MVSLVIERAVGAINEKSGQKSGLALRERFILDEDEAGMDF
jgi:hypothetical protein